VIAIDVPDSNYSASGNWPVLFYDGVHIPLADHSVDAVFSSNTLEHVRDLPGLLAELRRVIKPGGVGVHLMPSPAWRFWTTITQYIDVGKRGAAKLMARRSVTETPTEKAPDDPVIPTSVKRSLKSYLRRLLWPERHGEVGNAFTELYYFSPLRWRRVFIKSGWKALSVKAGGLFYTGYSVLDKQLSFPTRERLSRVLGSACWVYIVRPESE
jgi:SAM-dependent methyltransferase